MSAKLVVAAELLKLAKSLVSESKYSGSQAEADDKKHGFRVKLHPKGEDDLVPDPLNRDYSEVGLTNRQMDMMHKKQKGGFKMSAKLVVAAELLKLAKSLVSEGHHYHEHFRNTLKEHGAESPAHMSPEEKKEFFQKVKEGWKDHPENK